MRVTLMRDGNAPDKAMAMGKCVMSEYVYNERECCNARRVRHPTPSIRPMRSHPINLA